MRKFRNLEKINKMKKLKKKLDIIIRICEDAIKPWG